MKILLLGFFFLLVPQLHSSTADTAEYIIPYGFAGHYRTPRLEIGGHLIGGAVPSERSAFFHAKRAGHEPWTRLHPLMQAILDNPSEIEAIVRESKVDLNQPINGRFPLDFATNVAESPKAVSALLKVGADVDLKMFPIVSGSQKESFLHLMVQELNWRYSRSTMSFETIIDVIKVLVQYGADLSMRNREGNTPYMGVLDIYSLGIYSAEGRGLQQSYNRLLEKLMPLLRKGKSSSEIMQEFDTLISQAESQEQRSKLKRLLEQEFSIIIKEAKNEKERQSLKAVLHKNSHNRPTLLSRTINTVCRFAFRTSQ